MLNIRHEMKNRDEAPNTLAALPFVYGAVYVAISVLAGPSKSSTVQTTGVDDTLYPILSDGRTRAFVTTDPQSFLFDSIPPGPPRLSTSGRLATLDSCVGEYLAMLNSRLQAAQAGVVSEEQRWNALVQNSMLYKDLVKHTVPRPARVVVEPSEPCLVKVWARLGSVAHYVRYVWLIAILFDCSFLWDMTICSCKFSLAVDCPCQGLATLTNRRLVAFRRIKYDTSATNCAFEDAILLADRETLDSKDNEGITLLRRHSDHQEMSRAPWHHTTAYITTSRHCRLFTVRTTMPFVQITWLPKACRTAAVRKEVSEAVIKAMLSVKGADISPDNLVVTQRESRT